MGRIEDAHMIVCHMIGYYFMEESGQRSAISGQPNPALAGAEAES